MLFAAVQTLPPPRPNVTVFIHGTHRILHSIPKSFDLIGSFISPEKGLHKASELSPKFFYQDCMNEISKASPKMFPLNHCYFFCWPGDLSSKKRLISSEDLNKNLNKLTKHYEKKFEFKPQITLIGYSHGGNVAVNLLAVKNNKDYSINKLILLGSPVQDDIKELIKNNTLFESVYLLYSRTDIVQVMDPQGAKSRRKWTRYMFTNKGHDKGKPCNWIPFFSERVFKNNKEVKHISIKRKKRDLSHREFIQPRLCKKLGTIIDQADHYDFLHDHMSYLLS
jgi:hypothetical protein